MIPLDHRDTDNRANPYTEPNSRFSDSSDSLNSLNSTKVPLHLQKTPFFTCYYDNLLPVQLDSGHGTDFMTTS